MRLQFDANQEYQKKAVPLPGPGLRRKRPVKNKYRAANGGGKD